MFNSSSLIVFLFLLFGVGFCRRDFCPEVKAKEDFNIFAVLGPWYVIQYYSSSEEALTYHCMRTLFELSNGNMDMIMKLTYKYAADPNEETQTGTIIFQIPNPMRPDHWRHTEDHYKGVYNTDVIDTDHNSWLILLHCSDPESERKFLSTFVLARTPYLDKMTVNYLREKVSAYDVNLDYLFPVNQTFCFGEQGHYENDYDPTTTMTSAPAPNNENEEGDQDDLYFSDKDNNDKEDSDDSALLHGDGDGTLTEEET